MPDSGSFTTTDRTRVRRHPERAHYDRDTVHAILDAALMCHLGYVIDGLPYVTPTLFWRDGERLYWHGSSASRMLRTQRQGIPVCLTVSHIDGHVLGRSAFRHSLNYRAVMVFGTAAAVEDEREKEAGLNGFIERLYPGRTGLLRPIAPPITRPIAGPESCRSRSGWVRRSRTSGCRRAGRAGARSGISPKGEV